MICFITIYSLIPGCLHPDFNNNNKKIKVSVPQLDLTSTGSPIITYVDVCQDNSIYYVSIFNNNSIKKEEVYKGNGDIYGTLFIDSNNMIHIFLIERLGSKYDSIEIIHYFKYTPSLDKILYLNINNQNNYTTLMPAICEDDENNLYIFWDWNKNYMVSETDYDIYFSKMDQNGTVNNVKLILNTSKFEVGVKAIMIDNRIYLKYRTSTEGGEEKIKIIVIDKKGDVLFHLNTNSNITQIDDIFIFSEGENFFSLDDNVVIDTQNNIHSVEITNQESTENGGSFHSYLVYNKYNHTTLEVEITKSVMESDSDIYFNPRVRIDQTNILHILWLEEAFHLYYMKLDILGNIIQDKVKII